MYLKLYVYFKLGQILGLINEEGVFLEQLETDPSKYLPDPSMVHLSADVVKIDLNQSMSKILYELTKYPIRTRVSLTGTLVVARDIAHAKIKVALIEIFKLYFFVVFCE